MIQPKLIDSHCHLPMIEAEGGPAAVIDAARAAGVERMLCVAVDSATFPQVLQVARDFECVSASVGVHPNTQGEPELSVETLADLANDPQVVAIGETGLDYYRSEGDLEWQRQRFRRHARAAKAIGKPLIIHSREARGDTIRILAEEKAETVGGVMHCFVDDLDTAQRAMDLNFYISFSGIVTFKKRAGIARGGPASAFRAPVGGNRRAVPGARAPSRQAERTRLCAFRRRENR